jgi:hypothetical protein
MVNQLHRRLPGCHRIPDISRSYRVFRALRLGKPPSPLGTPFLARPIVMREARFDHGMLKRCSTRGHTCEPRPSTKRPPRVEEGRLSHGELARFLSERSQRARFLLRRVMGAWTRWSTSRRVRRNRQGRERCSRLCRIEARSRPAPGSPRCSRRPARAGSSRRS